MKNRTLIGETKTGHKGQWEPILDRRTFDRLQKHYAAQPRHTRRTPQSRGGKYSLSGGIAHCAKCGSIMVGSIRRYTNAPEKDRTIMACNQAHNAELKCGGTTIDFERLEAHVFDRVLAGLLDSDRWKQRSSEPDPNNDAKISVLEVRRDELQEERQRLLSLRLRDAISEDEFVEERARINTEHETVTREIDSLLDTTVLTDAIRDGLDWQAWSPMRRRNFLKALIKEVRIGGYPRKIEDVSQHTEESDENFQRRLARLRERYPNGFPNNVNRKPGESDAELQRRRDQLHADTIEARADIITN